MQDFDHDGGAGHEDSAHGDSPILDHLAEEFLHPMATPGADMTDGAPISENNAVARPRRPPPIRKRKPAKHIYLARNGERFGPYTLEQINAATAAGRIAAGDLAWMEGWSGWQPLSSVPGFSTSSPTRAYPPTRPRARPSAPGPNDWPRLFVGENYRYYAGKWEVEASKRTWNWAAFFLGLGWLAYRKMYLYSWILVGLMVLETLCEIVFDFPGYLSRAVNIGIAVACGSQANHWYKLHVEKKLREIASAGASAEAARARLAREGGTNMVAAVGFVAGTFALLVLMVALAH